MNGANASVTCAVIAANVSSVTSTPPNFSASDTTPSRIDVQAWTRRPRRDRSSSLSQMISVDPPPMSNMTIELGVAVGEVADASGGEMRLGLAVDDFEGDAEALADRGDEVGAVGGGAAGLGGDGAGARHAARRHLVAADSQRLERPRDRRLR